MTGLADAVEVRPADLDALFRPRSVAVVGASTSPEKLGAAMRRAVANFDGPVAFINTRIPVGEPDWYPSMAQARSVMGGPIDLALLCIPAAGCADALAEAAAAGCRSAVICSGGFAETGAAGASRQAELLAVVRDTGLRVLGPNTSGFIAPRRVHASFVPSVLEIPAGPVAVVSASGGMNHALAFGLAGDGVGVSLAVGLGLGIDVDQVDVIEYLCDDDETAVIGLCIESVPDGRRLMAAIRRAVAAKPVVALAVGRSDIQDFAASHTGVLVTSWRTLRAALRQAGAVVVDDDRQMISALSVLSRVRMQPTAARGVGLVTAQAGPGLLIADLLKAADVELPPVDEDGAERLRHLLADLTFVGNPVDTGRPGPNFGEVVRTLSEQKGIGVMLVYAIAELDGVDITAQIRSAGVGPAPLVVVSDGLADDVSQIRAGLAPLGVPVLVGVNAAVNAVEALLADQSGQLRARRDPVVPSRPPTSFAADGSRPSGEVGTKDLLDRLGFGTPARRLCHDRAEALAAFRELAGPVAVKIATPMVEHKTDIGGVHLAIADEAALLSAVDALRAIGATAFLVERMAPDGIDLIVATRRDPTFGVVVAVGLGGVAAEVLDDIAVRVAPLSADDAAEITSDLATRKLLSGWRGVPPLDRDQLGDLLNRLAGLLLHEPDMYEIEINPLRLCADGLIALDGLTRWVGRATGSATAAQLGPPNTAPAPRHGDRATQPVIET